MEKKGTKQKKAAVAAVAVLSAAIALTGTYAWQSIRQSTTNKKTVTYEVGGRLHDDFNGSTKSVYVENYTDPDEEESAPIFVRIRLLEYMETGEDAGKNRSELNVERGNVNSVVSNAEISKVETWRIHTPDDEENPFQKYWTWGLGGSTSYLPTFNKDNTNKDPDVNGTYEGTTKGDTVYYDDYVDYTADDAKKSVSGTAKYENGEQIEETHTVKQTQTAEVITMEKWKTDKNSQAGKYWVWDSDGWAYWAEPLQPGEATGLLLNCITPSNIVKSYYAIHVVNQQASAGDWGTKGDGLNGTGENATGFYTDGMTDDALALLNAISVITED